MQTTVLLCEAMVDTPRNGRAISGPQVDTPAAAAPAVEELQAATPEVTSLRSEQDSLNAISRTP